MKMMTKSRKRLGVGLLLPLGFLFTGCATTGSASRGGDGGTVDASGLIGPGRLNVGMEIEARPDSEQARAVAALLPASLEAELLEEGFRLDNRKSLLMVNVGVSVDALDRTGNYYTLNGRAEARVTASYDPAQPVLASRQVAVEGNRTLGETTALQALGTSLAAKLGPVVREAARVGAENLVAQTVSVRLPRLAMGTFQEYPARFVREVGSLSGVMLVELLESDRAERSHHFTIVHHPDAFPEGLPAALTSRTPLNIRFR